MAHAKTRLRYHVIFATKYRKKALAGIESNIYQAFRQAEAISDFTIIDMGIDDGDHIHLVIKFRPALSIAQVIRRMKQLSTIEVWNTDEPHLRKHYWGTKKRLWSGGYYIATIGQVSEDVVLEYVRKQAAPSG